MHVYSQSAAFPDAMIVALCMAAAAGGLCYWLYAQLQSERHGANALHMQIKQLEGALNTLSQGVAMFDAGERVLVSNAMYASMYGMRPEEVAPGTSLRDILVARAARGVYAGTTVEAITERLRDRVSRKKVSHWTARFADGRTIVVSIQPRPDGSWVNTHLDITEREKLREQLDAAMSSIVEGIAMFDRDQRLLLSNAQYAETYKIPAADIRPGLTLRQILDLGVEAGTLGGNEIEEFATSCRFLDKGEKMRRHRLVLKDGRFVDVTVTSTADGGTVTTHRDVTEQCASEARIVHMALHDTLTQLGNRVLLRERLEQALKRAQRGEEFAAIHLLDLDRFKQVNDTLGHPAGDALLVQVAERLRELVRATDTVARLGGDEFAIVQVGIQAPPDAAVLAERTIKSLSAPYHIAGQDVVIGASIGIAMAPANGSSFDELMRHADIALYRSKQGGKGRFCYFEPDMDAKQRDRHVLERDLRAAIEAGQFELHYQPLYSATSSDICGLEALVRWRHPTRGLVPPGEFIPLAETSGLISGLGALVLRDACTFAQSWPPHLRVAVNVSPVQLRDRRIVDTVAAALQSSGLEPGRLELEITETALLEARSSEVLRELKALGVRLALDDFGTGFSSISHLQFVRFDRIKIDRSFIQSTGPAEGACMVRGLVTLARALGLEATAEGIETESQLAMAKSEGCTEFQGYLLARPASADGLAALLLGRGARDARSASSSAA